MINEWQPANSEHNSSPDRNLLQEFATLIQQHEAGNIPVTDLNSVISADQQQRASGWLTLSEQDWQACLQQLPTEQLFPLAVFFTLAEQQLSGWQCGKNNPAIWIFRWLRQHQQLPDKDRIRQLKKMTDNRFIPYGSVM